MWPAVLIGSLGCYLLKFAGFLVPPRVLDRPAVRVTAGFIPVALLAALVVVQTFADRQALAIDARMAGLAAAVIALLLRAPFLVVVLVAAITAALLRAVGMAS